MTTVTFTTADKRLTLTVKSEFIDKCPNPEKFNIRELNKDFNMLTFLHNEKGPALIKHSTGENEMWLDGALIDLTDPELAKRMRAGIKFDDKFNEFIK